MEALILVLAKALVEHPEEVRVEVVDSDRETTYELYVHPDDVGKVIGKHGRIAKALRTVITSASAKHSKRVNLDIIA
jgi:predicted RNA-binding protein YlqC (UPF0109 family)